VRIIVNCTGNEVKNDTAVYATGLSAKYNFILLGVINAGLIIAIVFSRLLYLATGHNNVTGCPYTSLYCLSNLNKSLERNNKSRLDKWGGGGRNINSLDFCQIYLQLVGKKRGGQCLYKCNLHTT
jgi:hypothetical protein